MRSKKYQKYEKYIEDGYLSQPENYSTTGLVAEVYELINNKKEVDVNYVAKKWTSFLEKDRDSLLSLYTHIPYCTSKCSYCNTGSSKLQSEESLDNYVSQVIKFYHYFSDVFKGSVFDNLYIGGGTPNILSEDLLEKLLSELDSSFTVREDGEKTFENNPVSSSIEKLKIIKKYNINRVSFGVQTFNQKVLNLNNRGEQTEEKVRKAIADAKEVGFDCINIDLMIGLYGDSKDTIIKSFKQAMDLGPDSISIYLTQPVNYYLSNTYDNMSREEFFERRKKLIDNSFDTLLDVAENNNYDISDEQKEKKRKHFSNADCIVFYNENSNYRPKTRYVANPIHRLNSIFAVGHDSYSTVVGEAEYEMKKPLKDPEEYKFKLIETTQEQEMLKNVITNFANSKYLSLKEFKDKFDREFLEEYENTINELKQEGVIKIKGNNVQFDSESPKERLIYLLYFFDEGVIDEYIEILSSNEQDDREEQLDNNILSKELKNKIESFDSEFNSEKTKNIEGQISRIKDNSLECITDDEKREIQIGKNTLIIECFLQSGTYKTSQIKEITLEELNVNNEVVIFMTDDGNHLLIKKMTVVE